MKKLFLITVMVLISGCQFNGWEEYYEKPDGNTTDTPPNNNDNSTPPVTSIAPVLNNLVLSNYNSSSITIQQPTFSTAGDPAPTVNAYIGVSGVITVSGSVVSNAVQGPVDVSSGDYQFTGLSPYTDYKIIVVAQNDQGYSVKQIIQSTDDIAPNLNNLVITSSDSSSITLQQPTFSIAGNPTPTVNAYIGLDGTISLSGFTVSGSIQGPIDVLSGDHQFAGLNSGTSYEIIVVAKNSQGYSVQQIIQITTGIAAPNITWQKSLGGSSNDEAYSVQQTTDGGYIVAGSTGSNNGDVTGNHGNGDCWVVKLNSLGTIVWQKSLGGIGADQALSIQQTNDDGYIVAGWSTSINGDVFENHGGWDYWIVKLNSSGTIQWQKSLGGSGNDIVSSIQQTSDGGYIVAGYSNSNDGDVSGNHGGNDFWVVKLNSLGTIQWQKSLGGSSADEAYSVQQTTDGGYIVAGHSYSNDGDVTGNYGNGNCDAWIVKLNSLGTIVWQKSLGGSGLDQARSIQQTSDGGYIIAGYSNSNDGDVSGNHGVWDYWIVKLNSSGTIVWQKSLGGSGFDMASSIQQTSDGGYIVAGWSRSNDGEVSENLGENDYWIVKLNSLGTIVWQKSLGGSSIDGTYSIKQTNDGGYIVAGWSASINGDVSGNHGGNDFWVVKLQ